MGTPTKLKTSSRTQVKELAQVFAEHEVVELDRNKLRARGKRDRQDDFLEAYVNTLGLKHRACELTGMRFSTLKEWEKDAKFKQKLELAQQQVNERVEESLLRKFSTNSPVPEIFYLKSRDARYSQKVTLEGNESAPIAITYDEKTIKAVSKAIVETMKKE